MQSQFRNLHPTDAARVALIIWGKEYSEQRGGSMDFFDSLSPDARNRCELAVEELKDLATWSTARSRAAATNHRRTHGKGPISTAGARRAIARTGKGRCNGGYGVMTR